jgi:uncharacterized membrane protein YheB (UPF0754 family)
LEIKAKEEAYNETLYKTLEIKKIDDNRKHLRGESNNERNSIWNLEACLESGLNSIYSEKDILRIDHLINLMAQIS